MRVISGSASGVALRAPKGDATRPTTDRVRSSIFSILGDRVRGAVVLDLFAGCGTLGIESLSRGAASATFVESGREACACIEGNLARTGLAQDAWSASQSKRFWPARDNLEAAGITWCLPTHRMRRDLGTSILARD